MSIDAVIVSTARTPYAKSWRGAFNMSHGATLASQAVKAAIDRARIDPAEVEDVILGCGLPEGATGQRLIGHALIAGKRLGVKYVVTTMCIGGGMGAAGLFEVA
jgi:acetyl-CoA C-acetyltransferase